MCVGYPTDALRTLEHDRLVGDDDPRTGVGQHARELPGGRRRVERDCHQPGSQHPEVRRDELDPVDHRDRDPEPADQPEAGKPTGNGIGGGVER